ncbi:MAG: sugar ABC transporter substrate-binding protein [Dorea sp.]|nr:sugar ABC transporter substrate-binding protein [Dorea sp.]
MKKMIEKCNWKKLTAIVTAGAICLSGLTACNNSEEAKDESGDVTLTFALWDKLQKDGMEQMAAAFEEENPGIKIKVEMTPWEQYWTKMQASGAGNTLPDIFWMHPEQVYEYARGGKIMDISERIEKSDKVDMDKFPSNVNNDFNIDGKQYAIPKDYSTFGLWYNKDIFDEKKIAYPDETWDWDKLKEAAGQLTDKEKGIYGLLVQYNTNDAIYHYIWQNEGDIISEDETKSGFDDPATMEAVKYLADFVEKGYSPAMPDYANTTADQYFESGKAAMHIGGSWMCSEFTSIDGLNCDVAPLAQGKQRANLCGGMGYSISANTKHPEEAWKFMEFLAGEEANTIQCESGAAISAYEGTQSSWVEGFPDINAQVFVDAAEYGFSSQYCETRSKWVDIEKDYMTQVFSLTLPVDEGCKDAAGKINEALKK